MNPVRPISDRPQSSQSPAGEDFLSDLTRSEPAPERRPPAPGSLAPEPPIRIHPLLLLASLGIIPLVLHGAWQDGMDLDAALILGVFMAWGVFVILGFGVAWVAWRLSGRQNAAASSAFGVLLIVLAVGMFSEQARDARENAKRRRYEEQIREHASRADARAREQIRTAGIVDHDPEQTRAMVGTLDDAARQLSGPAAGIARACAQVLREIEAERAKLDEALERFLSAGGFDPVTLATPDAISARLMLLSRLEAATDEFHEFFLASPQRLRELLAEQEVPKAMIEREVAGFVQGARMDLVKAVRVQEKRVQAAGRVQLEILRSYYGYWQPSIDRGGGASVEFDPSVPASVITRFNRQARELTDAARRQAELQAEFFGVELPERQLAEVPTISG